MSRRGETERQTKEALSEKGICWINVANLCMYLGEFSFVDKFMTTMRKYLFMTTMRNYRNLNCTITVFKWCRVARADTLQWRRKALFICNTAL